MRFSRSILVVGLLMLGLLSACGGGTGETAVSPETDTASANASSSSRLTEDYEDALPVQSQLAIGTLQLEGTDRAVDEAMAAEILSLWRAVQSLDNSDTTAEAEITAVLNQIQNTMKPDQINAIAQMQLTSDSLTALIEDGTLSFGRGGGSGENAAAGGFAPPADGIPGSGGGQGRGQGGGLPGGLPAGASEDDIATRRAEREAGGASGFQARAMTNAVIFLLETKTGEATERVDSFAAMWVVLNDATSMTTEDIQTQMAEGTTLIELIEANGGDVEAVKVDLIESLQDSPIAQRQDLAEYVTNMLANSGGDE